MTWVWTKKRQIAHARNSAIRDLRMLYNRAQRDYFLPSEQKTLQQIIDNALERLKAEPETARRERWRRELDEAWRANR